MNLANQVVTGAKAGPYEGVARFGWAALVFFLVPAMAADDSQPAEVSALTSPRQGPTWVVLRWDSPADTHDVEYGEIPGSTRAPRKPGARAGSPDGQYNEQLILRREPRNWVAVGEVPGWTYSVVNLKADTAYKFRVRTHGVKGHHNPGPWAVVTVWTTSATGHAWAGLTVLPEKPLGTLGMVVTEPCIEAYRGRLYVVEAEGEHLWLSCVDPLGPKAEWTEDIAPHLSPEPEFCSDPDACMAGDKLWVTWQAQRGSSQSARGRQRQRLMYCDLSEPSGTETRRQLRERLSAPLEINPTRPGRDISAGSVAAYAGQVWVSWLETWRDGDGQARGEIVAATYDRASGELSKPTVWKTCPSKCPGSAWMGVFGGDLLVFFSDRTEGEEGAESLWSARFDGKRFHSPQLLRALGANCQARGVQAGDSFYFVYRSDANYPGAGGTFQDIVLGRLGPVRANFGGAADIAFSGYPVAADMKYNTHPDIALLGDTLYVVAGKQDQFALTPGGAGVRLGVRGFGTYLSAILRGPEALE